jgi:hypothetical protein
MTTTSEDRSEVIKTYVTPEEKQQIETMAAEHFESSASAAIRQLALDNYAQIYGDITSRAIQERRVDEETLAAVKAGNLATDTLDDALRYTGDDARVPTADGGVTPHPSSYSATLTKHELAQTGTQLTWEDLKDAVSDQRWDDSLVIHPDRVRPESLNQKRKESARVVAAIARHYADGGVLRGDRIRELIDEYLLHLSDRANEEESRAYIHETYTPLVTEDMYEGPQAKRVYYTDEDACPDPAAAVESTLKLKDRTERILDRDEHQAGEEYEDMKASIDAWRADLGEWLTDVATIRKISQMDDVDFEQLDYPEEAGVYHDGQHFLTSVWRGDLEAFSKGLTRREREQIFEDHVPEDALEALPPLERIHEYAQDDT